MTRTGWTAAFAVCMFSAVTGMTSAPPVAAPSVVAVADTDSLRSTQLGVYTDDQAKRGQQTYASVCASCHQPTSHLGANFEAWDQHKLIDLYTYVHDQMPQDNPGSLAPAVVTDVVAYLLKVYAMPTADTELAPDTLVMKKILIDSRKRPPL